MHLHGDEVAARWLSRPIRRGWVSWDSTHATQGRTLAASSCHKHTNGSSLCFDAGHEPPRSGYAIRRHSSSSSHPLCTITTSAAHLRDQDEQSQHVEPFAPRFTRHRDHDPHLGAARHRPICAARLRILPVLVLVHHLNQARCLTVRLR